MGQDQNLQPHHQQVQPSPRYFASEFSTVSFHVCALCLNHFILYSQLDTLPKDDLIKFAKKQMAAMQKMKSRYAGS